MPPTSGPTNAPTDGPTQAPTRSPTSSKHNFGSMIKIVYVLKNLFDEDLHWILNNTHTYAIAYIQEIIEAHYFNAKFLPSYEYFTVQVITVNDVNYKKADQFIEDNVLYNDFGVFTGEE
eukprot:448975_1